MSTSDTSVFYKVVKPPLQAVVVFVIAICMMGMGKLIETTHLMDISPRFAWMIAGAFMLFFGIFNSVFGLSAPDWNRYFITSLICFACLAVANGFLAYAFSSLSINEAGTFRWIYFVLIFAYLVLMSIMQAIRKIFEIAQREDKKMQDSMKN